MPVRGSRPQTTQHLSEADSDEIGTEGQGRSMRKLMIVLPGVKIDSSEDDSDIEDTTNGNLYQNSSLKVRTSRDITYIGLSCYRPE